MRWNGEGRREATVELAVLAARGLAADGLEQVALGVALRLAGVHARVEVAPVTALEGSCAAALTAWPKHVDIPDTSESSPEFVTRVGDVTRIPLPLRCGRAGYNSNRM